VDEDIAAYRAEPVRPARYTRQRALLIRDIDAHHACPGRMVDAALEVFSALVQADDPGGVLGMVRAQPGGRQVVGGLHTDGTATGAAGPARAARVERHARECDPVADEIGDQHERRPGPNFRLVDDAALAER